MYLETLKLWNFRKYGHSDDRIEPDRPDLKVRFNRGLNLLIGENESGKSTVLDVIRSITVITISNSIENNYTAII